MKNAVNKRSTDKTREEMISKWWKTVIEVSPQDIDSETIRVVSDSDIERLLSQSNDRLLGEIEKYFENNIPRYLKGGELRNQYFVKGWNECREEQRKALSDIRKLLIHTK